MKVKRIIKGVIYLFPVICVFIVALGSLILRFNKNFFYLERETTNNNVTIYTYIGSDLIEPLYNGLSSFHEYVDMDIDSRLRNQVSSLLENIFLPDNDGGLHMFICDVITYEMVAIIICAVLDVIFLIPEFYNKIEDKYIKGGKKRE